MKQLPLAPPAIVNAAVSTSASDNIAAINDAIATAAQAGTGLVLLPPGTFQLAPTASSWIVLKSGVTIQGAGPATILKVKNDAGDYPAIFSPTTFSTALTNVGIRDLRIDQNASGNTTCDIVVGVTNKAQFAVYATNCTNVSIDRVIFDQCVGINTVALSGATVEDCWVRDCIFRFVQGTAVTRDYDNSAIYLRGKSMHAIGNKFYSTIAQNARGGCEFHSGLGSFIGNVSDGYNTLINIVTASQGDTDLDANQITVQGNVALNAGHAISLWSTSGQTMRGVSVIGNTLHVAQIDWDESTSHGIAFVYESGSGLTGSYDGIDISHNIIRMQPSDTRTVDGAGEGLAYASTYGIGLSPKGSISTITVRDNIICAPPIYGIYLGNPVELNTSTNVAIEENTIVDTGSNSSTVATRTAINATANLTDVSIARNRIRDTGAGALIGQNWIIINSGLGTVVRVTVEDNRVSSVFGALAANVDKTKVSDLTKKTTWNPGAIAAGATDSTTVTVVGVDTTDVVIVNPSAALNAGLTLYAYVSSVNTVTIVLTNATADSIDPASNTYRVRVIKGQVDA